jgi:hypothetical protein
MTYEWLTSLKSSANLQYRLEEENRLDQWLNCRIPVH